MVYTNQQKQRYARQLRRNQTKGEKSLRWLYLLGFKPQQVTRAGYVADWYNKRSYIVVEVDGGIHLTMKAKDKARDKHHRLKGEWTIRVTDRAAASHPLLTGIKIVFIGVVWQLRRWLY